MVSMSSAIRALDELTNLCRSEGRTQLTEWETYQVLRQWQIPVAACRLTAGSAEAAAFAGTLGSPVAVKVVSPDIAHKTDAGCVRLGLAGEAQVAAAYEEVLENARAHQPQARIHGVLVQQMAPPGVEIIAGGLRDSSFGPILMVGLGGIFTEVLKDVAFRLAPLRPAQAEELLRELKGYPLLTGARGREPADLDGLVRTLVNLSRLIDAWHDLRELDLNPLIASPGGVVAVDGLATIQG